MALVRRAIALLVATTVLPIAGPTFAQAPKGEIKGSALVHTADSAKGVISGASVALPSKATGGTAYFGKWQDMPAATPSARVPVVVFLHGSSGLGLAAIGEWQRWLAEQGIASVAPDSFALPDRLTYSSPIDRKTYESIHALRASEIDLALASVRAAAWADTAKLVLPSPASVEVTMITCPRPPRPAAMAATIDLRQSSYRLSEWSRRNPSRVCRLGLRSFGSQPMP